MEDAIGHEEGGGEEVNEEMIVGDGRIDDDDEDEDEDDEDDEEEMRERRELRDEVIRQVDGNDPSLCNIWIGTEEYDYAQVYPKDGDWKGFGASLGRNTHIKEITFSLITSEMGVQEIHSFFRGLAMNRCIQKLSFEGIASQSDDIFLLLVPFFIRNQKFDELVIEYIGHRDGCLSKIAFALSQFYSLSEFHITCGTSRSISEGRDASCELIEALVGHVGLCILSFNRVPIGRDACSALANLLRIRGSILDSLSLHHTQIDDEGADILSSGLIGNIKLTKLDLAGNCFTEIGWQAIFAMLKNPQCRLMSLDLGSTDINDAVARSLTNALSRNRTLKKLFLRNIFSTTTAGWMDLFMGILLGPHCKLESLDLSDSGGDRFETMIEPLVSALARNNHLKVLILRNDMNRMPATSVGWQNFTNLLLNPNSALKELVLTGNTINDDIISAFASALTNNNQLRKIQFGHYGNTSPVTSVGNDAFSRMLCDTSTILNTFNSNHTLASTGFSFQFSEDIYPLLSINQKNSIRQAARIKIIKSHFSGSGINTQVFTEMKLNVLPTAIAWMGRNTSLRNGGSHGGRNLMFEFLRKEPLVCDMKRTSKKWKCRIEVK